MVGPQRQAELQVMPVTVPPAPSLNLMGCTGVTGQEDPRLGKGRTTRDADHALIRMMGRQTRSEDARRARRVRRRARRLARGGP